MSDEIAQGSRVVMHFTLSLTDGTVVETSDGDEPMTFNMGDGSLDAGLEHVLLGLHPGVRVRFNLSPGQEFGESDPTNVHHMARGEFPPDMVLEEGTVVGFATPSGDEVPGTVVSADDKAVEVDFNHPLAGRALIFDVEVISVGDAPDETGDT